MQILQSILTRCILKLLQVQGSSRGMWYETGHEEKQLKDKPFC